MAPPEWLKGSVYRPSPATVWQVGVVLFELLHKRSRFSSKKFLKNKQNIRKELSESKNNASIHKLIRRQKSIHCSSSYYDGLSITSYSLFPLSFTTDCQDFLQTCLSEDPKQRPTLEQLQCHPWLS